MPTYEYACTKCGCEFEELLKIADRLNPLSNPCPDCGESNNIVFEMRNAPMPVSPFSISGLIKPKGDFRERMAQIKHGHRNMRGVKIKDY